MKGDVTTIGVTTIGVTTIRDTAIKVTTAAAMLLLAAPPLAARPGQSSLRHDGFAGRLTCEARGSRTQRCSARTQNRVELLTRSAACVRGRTWGFDARHIWVSHGCRGTFAYGWGNHSWSGRPGSGVSAGAIIGGVAVAAGLAAILGNRNNSRPSSSAGQNDVPPPPPMPDEPEPEMPAPAPFPPGPPAVVKSDLSPLPADARPSMNTCLMEAARQVGVTGGTQVRFDRLVHIEPGNGGWRFRAELIATYPDSERILPMFCRATPTRVVELDFRT
ncbi:MAG: DUF3011 domain-containing protein [Novosphingobium sp.]|jgi:hypothetical protein|nr:DUF3011 domain-containing protein [Novosphingobium sp.]